MEPTTPAAPPGASPQPAAYARPPATYLPPAAVARRTPRAGAWALRVTLTLLALGCVAQPLLIGRYLDGDYGAVGDHGDNGVLLLFLTTAAGVAAIFWWIGGGHPLPLVALVGLWFVMGFQIGMGHTRNLSIHIPLGVAIVTTALVAAGWSWTGRVFRRAR